MDGLALLCNLFADGPVTLKRLRLARVANLGELERAPPAQLAEWLHASLPQARAFVEEARRLVRRLAEDAVPLPPPVSRRTAGFLARTNTTRADADVLERVPPPSAPTLERAPRASEREDPLAAARLVPGLWPGLDEALCERLQRHQVRTVRALAEFAGLDLARRTGIPYSTLLELARRARRFAGDGGGDGRAGRTLAVRAVPLSEIELRPFLAQPRRAPAEAELTRTDEFTLPTTEPESAGPFV